MISRPLLVLSIATAFSEEAESSDGTSGSAHETSACPEVPSEISSVQTTLETRYGIINMDEAFVEIIVFENFLNHLYSVSLLGRIRVCSVPM